MDGLHINKSGRQIASEDTKRIHARDVEEYTLVYMRDRKHVLQVALTLEDEGIPKELLQLLHTLPPIQDLIRAFILTTG